MKKELVTFKIPNELYLFYNKLKIEENEKRRAKGLKEFSTSSFYNSIINIISDEIIHDEGRFIEDIARARIHKLNNFKLDKPSKRVINARLNSYNIYKLDNVFNEINNKKRSENIRLLLTYFYIKNRA